MSRTHSNPDEAHNVGHRMVIWYATALKEESALTSNVSQSQENLPPDVVEKVNLDQFGQKWFPL